MLNILQNLIKVDNETIKDIIIKRAKELEKLLKDDGKKILIEVAKLTIEKEGKITKEDIKQLLSGASDEVVDALNKFIDNVVDDLAVLAKEKLKELIEKI